MQREYLRPSIQEFSDVEVAARSAKANPSSRAPFPYGWDFDLSCANLLLEPSASDCVRYVKAFGFVAHIHDATSDDTPSPFTDAVVLKLPFRFVSKDSELKPSWAFARVNAFASKANFPKK